MAVKINLQRNTDVFYSTVDLAGGAAATAMTPANTWKVEVIAGYAFSQGAATQDITTLESGLTPDRSSQRFRTAINPVDWNFQAYVRPTGVEANQAGVAGNTTGNVKPVADWYLWQALLNNTKPASGTVETSAWQGGGKYDTTFRAASTNIAAHNPNFAVMQENFLYMKVDNIVYQVSNAAIESADVDAAIDGIATTTWTGMGTHLLELTGATRDIAIAVFGGINNAGTTITANSSTVIGVTDSYHPWATWNVNGTVSTASFIKNRLSALSVYYTAVGGGVNNYTFPLTALSISVKNNMTYLTPEEIAALNRPIGQFSGSREITGTFSAYLRAGDSESAGFWRNMIGDTRTNISQAANANIQIGGATSPYLAMLFPAVSFDVPTHAIEDVVGITVNFKAQEPTSTQGTGGEIILFAKK